MATATDQGRNDRSATRAPSSTSTHTTETRSTETKSALKTTELMVFIASVIAVLIAAAIVDESDAGGFGARQAWLYVTILAVGYMVSRGFAKSGSRDPYASGDNRSGTRSPGCCRATANLGGELCPPGRRAPLRIPYPYPRGRKE